MYNAALWTFQQHDSDLSGFWVKDGRFLAVFNRTLGEKLMGDNQHVPRFDMRGKLVTPGLIDSHAV